MKKIIIFAIVSLLLFSNTVFASNTIVEEVQKTNDGYKISWQRINDVKSYYIIFYEEGNTIPFETKILEANAREYSLTTTKKVSKIEFHAFLANEKTLEKTINLKYNAKTGNIVSPIIKEVRNSPESLFVILNNPNKYDSFFVNFYGSGNSSSEFLFIQKNETKPTQGWVDNFIYFSTPTDDATVEIVGIIKGSTYFYDYYEYKAPKKVEEVPVIIEDTTKDTKEESNYVSPKTETPQVIETNNTSQNPSKNKKNEFIFEVNYPKTKEVYSNSDIIVLNVNNETFTDVKVNNKLIYEKLNYKAVLEGIQIPLKQEINNVEIISYDNQGNRRSFNTTIKYNSFFNFNSDNTNSVADFEVEEVEINQNVELIFDKRYGDVIYENEQTRVRGKAKNADTLFVNKNEVKLDNAGNFEFILKLKEGDNRVVFEASNELDSTEEVIIFKYVKLDNVINANEIQTFEIPSRITPEESEEIQVEKNIVYDNENNINETDLDVEKSPTSYVFLGISVTTVLVFLFLTIKKNFTNDEE